MTAGTVLLIVLILMLGALASYSYFVLGAP